MVCNSGGREVAAFHFMAVGYWQLAIGCWQLATLRNGFAVIFYKTQKQLEIYNVETKKQMQY